MVKTLSLLCVFCATHALYSQEKKELSIGKAEIKSTKSPSIQSNVYKNNPNKEVTYSVNRNGVQVEHNKEYFQQQLESIDRMIRSIDIKVEYVKNDVTENQLALDSGWYDTMETKRKFLLKKKEEVTVKIKSL